MLKRWTIFGWRQLFLGMLLLAVFAMQTLAAEKPVVQYARASDKLSIEMDVIYRYLDCGDLKCGFAEVKCIECGHEFLVGYSCKRRHFCPSCHQKRVVEYGQWLLTHVLKAVPHRQWVFSIPKRLRIYFMYERKLLAQLSKCAWKVINVFLKSAFSYDDAAPGASIAVHTYGDFLNFNPHLHAIVSHGCFRPDGTFQTAPNFDQQDLEEAFRYGVF